MNENPQREDGAQLPEHLIALHGGQWAVWRCAALRGAGFPVSTVLSLAAPALASAADRLFVAEREAETAKNLLLQQINEALDDLKRNNEWDNAEKRGPLLKARTTVKSNKPPKGDGLAAPDLCANGQRLAKARAELEELQGRFGEQYDVSVRHLSKTLREVAASGRFREAMLWQNRQALHTAVDPLLRKPLDGGAHSSKQRQYESLIASYLQRYCAKNDTIGFFGPVGWAEFVSGGPALSVRAGESLVQDRKTYFEVWGIEALAKQIAGKSEAKPWLKPLRLPFVRVDGTTLHHPLFGAIKIPAVHAAILTASNGQRNARDIARMAMRWPSGGITSESQVYELLDQMVVKGLIFNGFNVPLHPFPERVLRQSFSQLGDERLRREALSVLDEIEGARGAVAESAGDAEKLDATLEELEKTFTRLTDTPAQRSHGQTYAARTLVYEDCRRNVEVRVGPGLLQTMAEPLSLLLMSARWLTTRFAAVYREELRKIYDELVGTSNSSTIDSVRFWLKAIPLLLEDQSEIKAAGISEFRKKWDRILSLDLSRRRVSFTAEELWPKVREEFFTSKAGWKGGRYHSPDIMIVAPSAEAVNRGDYQLVMGEFHIASNTLGSSLFFHQHPQPESLARATRLDMPETRIIPVPPKDYMGRTARTTYSLSQPDDFLLEFSRDSFALERSQALPIASLIIGLEDDELIAHTRDNSLRFDLVEFMGNCLNWLILDSFRIFTAQAHTPRLSIDRLVISRETWRFAAPDLTFAFEKNEAARFLAIRRWASAHRLPRFAFVKVPVEVKPCYVDFDSPVYVDIFAKLVRRTADAAPDDAAVSVSEMLPGPEQLWLVDAGGERYTSEFRAVIVDLSS